jgi:hypothetical protein
MSGKARRNAYVPGNVTTAMRTLQSEREIANQRPRATDGHSARSARRRSDVHEMTSDLVDENLGRFDFRLENAYVDDRQIKRLAGKGGFDRP